MKTKPKIYFCWTYLAKISFMAYYPHLSYCHHCFKFSLNNTNLYLVSFLLKMCSYFPIYFHFDYCLIQFEAKMIILVGFFHRNKYNLHWKKLFLILNLSGGTWCKSRPNPFYFSKIKRVRFMTDFWTLFCLSSVPPRKKMNGGKFCKTICLVFKILITVSATPSNK